jgi:hypothetical protein
MPVERQEDRKAPLFIPPSEEPPHPQILNKWVFNNGNVWFLASAPHKCESINPTSLCSGQVFVKYTQGDLGFKRTVCHGCEDSVFVDLAKLQIETKTLGLRKSAHVSPKQFPLI